MSEHNDTDQRFGPDMSQAPAEWFERPAPQPAVVAAAGKLGFNGAVEAERPLSADVAASVVAEAEDDAPNGVQRSFDREVVMTDVEHAAWTHTTETEARRGRDYGGGIGFTAYADL